MKKRVNAHLWSRRAAVKLRLAGVAAASASAFTHASERSSTAPTVSLLAGEPTSSAVILQARFTTSPPTFGDVTTPLPSGVPGFARFELSDEATFRKPLVTPWLPVEESADFIARTWVERLKPTTHYSYRTSFKDREGRITTPTQVGRFKTLPAATDRSPISFAVFSCLSYELFFGLGEARMRGPWRKPAEGAARQRGYPAMDLMRTSEPAFLVATGDTVYYDHPSADPSLWATSVPQMREKWHRQFAVPSVRDALSSSATFFMKDDHDFRFDDADDEGANRPSAEDGRKIFLEKVPLATLIGPTYRTHRVNRHLQVWMLEGRDYRSLNDSADGPSKTLWGSEQRQWLEQTLIASDADFKIVISPTPIVGPDDQRSTTTKPPPADFGTKAKASCAFRAITS